MATIVSHYSIASNYSIVSHYSEYYDMKKFEACFEEEWKSRAVALIKLRRESSSQNSMLQN